MVEAVFESLKNVDEENLLQNENKNSDSITERILNAKTVNGLLSISEGSQQINRNHALKVITVFYNY